MNRTKRNVMFVVASQEGKMRLWSKNKGEEDSFGRTTTSFAVSSTKIHYESELEFRWALSSGSQVRVPVSDGSKSLHDYGSCFCQRASYFLLPACKPPFLYEIINHWQQPLPSGFFLWLITCYEANKPLESSTMAFAPLCCVYIVDREEIPI